jgi:hypothetical protein
MRGIGNESKDGQDAERDPENGGNAMFLELPDYCRDFSGHGGSNVIEHKSVKGSQAAENAKTGKVKRLDMKASFTESC